MDLPYMYDVCMTRLTHDSTHSTHSIRLLTRLDDSTHSTRLQDALSILFNRDFLRITVKRVFESEMGSSSSAASERWRSVARASASRCAFAGSSKYHGIHCDVGVDFSPAWRSYCRDQPGMPVATGWLWSVILCLDLLALRHRQADIAETYM